MSIKIKKQTYIGRPSITIYISDLTKKVHAKIEKIQNQEEKARLQQSQTFSSSVSHELRTPLNSTIFFLKSAMKLVKKWKEQLPAEFVVDVEKNFSFMMS